MNRKMAGVLLIAVVCGLGAMLVSSRMLGDGGGQAAPETQEILVAARDLNAEEVLKPEHVKKATLPKQAVPAGVFTDPKDLEDRWVQIKHLEGEPIVDKKLAAKGTPTGLVARIPKGKRAFALNVNEQSGVSGFILPNHHVDVIQVKPVRQGESADQALGETVLEDLLVLASGTTFTNPTDRSILSKTVTVAVTPDEAQVLTAAQARGQLSLALRGMNDRDRAPVVAKPEPPKVVAAVPEPKPEPKPEPVSAPVAEKPKLLAIYRGGKLSQVIRLGQPEDPGEDDPGDGFPPSLRVPRVRP
jgi:pilus assembly protein CpaB